MAEFTLTGLHEIGAALRHADLKQALYDEGAVIMQDTLVALHGAEHHARRTLEFRVFRRDFARYYETEVFPRTLGETLAPFVVAGRADLIDLGYRVTMNLTADFAGIDRPERSPAETEALLKLVMTFSEGATLVHSTRDKEVVRQEVRDALERFDERFLKPSLAKRLAILERFRAGDIDDESLPRDVLTVLLRNEDKIELTQDLIRREAAFYLQAGSHSTANSTTHAFHEIMTWAADKPGMHSRLLTDPLFLQRCVHESFRLHPASPVAWRTPTCPLSLGAAGSAEPGDRVVLELAQANRDATIFGANADSFDPYRTVPHGVNPFGLTFGAGVHACLGRDLDGGTLPRADTDPTKHQYGIVTLFLRRLLELGARPDPDAPPERATYTARTNWGRYPIVFGGTTV